MITDSVDPRRLEDCVAVALAATEPRFERSDILTVSAQTGGLFNFLLRMQTTKGVFYFKQYLDDVSSSTYGTLPKTPAIERARLACKVQELASEATRSAGMAAVPRIVHFDSERSALLMTRAPGTMPLVDHLSAGEIPESFVTQLPHVLASLHESTYGRFDEESIHANCVFRDFKLKLQYDDIAERLDALEARAVMRCKQDYVKRAICVTHGDINSRNILVGDDEIGVIDFEQSHLGAPAYDLAYILSEVFIALRCAGAKSLGLQTVNRFIDRYFERFSREKRDDVEREMAPHLAVQILYRFWGPSRASWTFYVDERCKEDLIHTCRALLVEAGSLDDLLNG